MKAMNILLDPPRDFETVLRSIGLSKALTLIIDLVSWFRESPDADEEVLFNSGYYYGMVFSGGVDTSIGEVFADSQDRKELFALGKFMGAYWMQALRTCESKGIQPQIDLNVVRRLFERLHGLDMQDESFVEILGAVLAPLFYGRQMWPHEEYDRMRRSLLGIAEELRIRNLHPRAVESIVQGLSS